MEQDYRISYDEFADTLYLSIGEPQKATNSYFDENNRTVYGTITGITIIGFVDRQNDNSWNDSLVLKYLPKFNTKCLSKFCKNIQPKERKDVY